MTRAPRRAAPPSDLVRLSLALGSGLVRDYALSAPLLGASSLSHAVQPVAWFALDAELRLPSVPVSFFARGGLRPVGYAIAANDVDRVEPRGMLIDSAFGARYHLHIAGPADRPVELVPAVALRYSISNVDFHPGNIIPNTDTWVLGGGVGLNAPLTSSLEVWLRGRLGPVLSYDEAPLASGLFAGGWSAEVGFGARVWITESFGLTFDGRFTHDNLSFEEGPSRFVPRTERGLLEDARLAISDLRAGAGCTVRL